MKRFTVYALVDPRTALPRYIGITSRSAFVRLNEHRCHAKARIPGLATWFDELMVAGLNPSVVILERVPSDGIDGERRWIAHFRNQRAPLFNKADGGQGATGVLPTPEKRARVSAKLRGRQFSQETRAKLSAAITGKARPDLAQRNKAAATLSDEQVASIRNRLAHGEKGVAIASEFGISTAMVSLIKQNKRRS
ncbi:NUMOD3 domain-containing DNA-binding protein [uncultured Devosia sp.]|uniref:NUMOD3 domain-containing DNA-binding protein n=1 Tax=uncultured Devosia sp. TaxID=211434 RepID=UPI002628F620|nr:NUMOD3 domain-containing DNA-binding protein [uncultured Devosia sp.]